MKNAWAVIMAGGAGKRFWPLSRVKRPKQLLDLFGEGEMLKVTSERIQELIPAQRQLVVTGTVLSEPVRSLLPELPHENILEESVARNTAAAIGWAAIWIRRRDPDALMMVLPADHHVANIPRYQGLCADALRVASEGSIVTLGIEITRPETGYGYIEAGAPVDGGYRVSAFKEKPDVETALSYIAKGGFYWNAGMFFMSVSRLLEELEAHEPELYRGLLQLDKDDLSPEEVAAVYHELKSISIDYAVMERARDICVIPGDFGWSDVGSWRTLYDFRQPETTSFTAGDVIEIDGGGNVLFSDTGTLAAVGVSDLIVVQTGDATLVCPRDSAQRIREIVSTLEARDQKERL